MTIMPASLRTELRAAYAPSVRWQYVAALCVAVMAGVAWWAL